MYQMILRDNMQSYRKRIAKKIKELCEPRGNFSGILPLISRHSLGNQSPSDQVFDELDFFIKSTAAFGTFVAK